MQKCVPWQAKKKNELAAEKRTKIMLIQVLTQLREYKKVESVRCGVVGPELARRGMSGRQSVHAVQSIQRLDWTLHIVHL